MKKRCLCLNYTKSNVVYRAFEKKFSKTQDYHILSENKKSRACTSTFSLACLHCQSIPAPSTARSLFIRNFTALHRCQEHHRKSLMGSDWNRLFISVRTTCKLFVGNKSKAEQSDNSGCGTSVQSLCNLWTEIFERNSVPEARTSIEYIVAHILGKKTLFGVSNDLILSDEEVRAVDKLCHRRLKHEPVQYILEEWDFDDLVLTMRSPVFIPRPETEELVGLSEKLIKQKATGPTRLLELCCGSGALTLALLSKLAELTAVAVDVSEAACRLTQENAERHALSSRISVVNGDLADPSVIQKVASKGPFDILVSNPPYVPKGQMDTLELQILRYEDLRALDGGTDGLDIVRQILSVSSQLLLPNSDILLEIHPGQPKYIEQLVSHTTTLSLRYITSYNDYLGRERFCHLQTNLQ